MWIKCLAEGQKVPGIEGESNPEPFDPESRVQSNIPLWHYYASAHMLVSQLNHQFNIFLLKRPKALSNPLLNLPFIHVSCVF